MHMPTCIRIHHERVQKYVVMRHEILLNKTLYLTLSSYYYKRKTKAVLETITAHAFLVFHYLSL